MEAPRDASTRHLASRVTGVGGGGWRWFVAQIAAFESIRQYYIMPLDLDRAPSHVGQPAAAARAAFSFQTRPRAITYRPPRI